MENDITAGKGAQGYDASRKRESRRMGLKHLIRWMMKEQVRQIKEEEAIIKAILKANEKEEGAS